MNDEDDHTACVHAWMERAAKGLPPERLTQAFEQGFAALWWRAHRTLGDVTLTAIVNRVLHNGAERFPILSVLELDANGIRFQRLRESAAGVSQEQLAEGLRFVLVEFLTVLGNLTAEILTPALHAELAKVAPLETGLDENRPRDGTRAPESKDVDGVKP